VAEGGRHDLDMWGFLSIRRPLKYRQHEEVRIQMRGRE
jgi:hypothetical protein